MGFISSLAGSKSLPTRTKSPDPGSVRAWRQAFGVNKEDPRPAPLPTLPGGSSASIGSASSSASFKRLLDSWRSFAPGGWSDNRYEQTGHFTGINYVALHSIAKQMMRAEFQVYHKDPMHPDGKRPVLRGEEAYKLVELLERPNAEDTFGDMMYEWTMQQGLTGQALTALVPNVIGRPYEMYVVPTAIAPPGPVMSEEYPNGYYQIQPIYPYGPFSTLPGPQSAAGARIPAEWMLRFRWKHPLFRHDCYSPLTALRLHLDEVESIDKSRWSTMRRSINPNAVVNMDQIDGTEPLPPEEIERIRAEFESYHQGPENHGTLLFSPPGGRIEPWQNRAADMEYQSGWDQLCSFVMAGHGITKPVAGMLDTASYSTLFAALKQFYWMTLEPLCEIIAGKLTKHLARFFGDDLIVEVKGRRIDDHDLTHARIQIAMSAMAITKNEVRKSLDMPLTSEPWGMEIAGTQSFLTDPMLALEMGLDPFPPQQPGVFPGMQSEQTEAVPLEVVLGGPDALDDGKGRPAGVTQGMPHPRNLGRGSRGPVTGTGRNGLAPSGKSFSLNGRH